MLSFPPLAFAFLINLVTSSSIVSHRYSFDEMLLNEYGIKTVKCTDEGTIVHVAMDNDYLGHIHIGDKIKPTSKEAIASLKKSGIEKTVMLTGDEKTVAEKVGRQLNIDEVYSNLLPQDKVNIVQKLIDEKNKKDVLVFVGDGINDAPALAAADIGKRRNQIINIL